ncbi:MAG: polysaccharide deacetylase family protein, partial [Proteobacteria bacterium]|nr:polysaccharide deacetylase family protein [Desulfobulbaceae bacterium]MBU4152909.1 polysaccharide deacetylase family protein [Pseudomonadota bacterium]
LAQKLLHRKGLTILSYHGVTKTPMPFEEWCFVEASQFRKHVSYLRDRFDLVPLSTAIQMLDQGTIRRPTAVITFDDGFQNNYDIAFPVLQEFNAPATIFLVTDRIGTDRTLWFCRIYMALAETKITSLSWEGQRFNLTTPAGKAKASKWLQNAFKGLPFDRLLHELANLQKILGVERDSPVSRNSPFRMLDPTSIRTMKDSGLIEFGGHTHTHAILSRLTPDKQYEQITLSKHGVEQHTDLTCRFFAYPNGAPSDHDSTTTRILTHCGIIAAVNMEHGLNYQDTHHLHLYRFGIGADTCFPRFKLMAHGFT